MHENHLASVLSECVNNRWALFAMSVCDMLMCKNVLWWSYSLSVMYLHVLSISPGVSVIGWLRLLFVQYVRKLYFLQALKPRPYCTVMHSTRASSAYIRFTQIHSAILTWTILHLSLTRTSSNICYLWLLYFELYKPIQVQNDSFHTSVSPLSSLTAAIHHISFVQLRILS